MRVKEIFYSLQGEGYYAGTPAVFIRFAGCNLSCPFCDTDWKGGEEMSEEEVVAAACSACDTFRPGLVVLTGGEPSLQVTERFLKLLHQWFPVIAMETNGTHRLPRGIDFVTVSPKEDFCDKNSVILRSADELKVVFDGVHSPDKWPDRVHAFDLFLQPCDTGDAEENKSIIDACVQYIKQHPKWRLSLQTQKILNIR